MMAYYNLQIIYNFTVSNKNEEQEILKVYEEAGEALEKLPHFEVKEINRQTKKEALNSCID